MSGLILVLSLFLIERAEHCTNGNTKHLDIKACAAETWEARKPLDYSKLNQ